MQRPGTRWWFAAAACALLAVVHTWPLAQAPGTWSRNDNGDAQLNEWIMAWVAHQLPHDPADLFQGNIFYPARDTLAFSEPLIVPAVLGAPVAWLGGSPVLVFNLMVLAGFALTAYAGYTVVARWTGDRAAGLLAGSALAFNTHTLTRLAHVQGLHLYGLPLALLAADHLIAGTGRRAWLWLALWMTVMAATSGYLVVFATIMLGVAVVARAVEWWPRARQTLTGFGLAGAVSIVAILPIYLPYRRVAEREHMIRPLDSVLEYSATLKGYLAASGTIHISTWSASFFKDPVDSFFPGFVVLFLALVAVRHAIRRSGADGGARRTRSAMLAGIAAAGLILSLGTHTPVYGWLYAIFPPMHGLRAAARFGNLFLLGMAMLAGFGFAQLRRRHPATWGTAVAAIVTIAAVNGEALRAPFEYRRFTRIPPIYRLLAAEPGRVVLAEMPFYPRQAVFENAEYVLNSTAHWRPLLNGYSGYTPESYSRLADQLWYFPEDRAFAAMRRAGVTHVMVHPSRFLRDADLVIEQMRGRPELDLVAVGDHGLRLYRLR